MTIQAKRKAVSPFPEIRDGIVDRLSTEADDRTMQPETVDWKEIHRRAAVAQTND